MTEDQHKVYKLKLELDYIERQIYMRVAKSADYERLRVIRKLLRELTK